MWTNPNTVCTFSLDVEEGFRQTSSMESRQSAQLKSIRTASKSSPRDSRRCQCGTMSPHSLWRQESAQKCLNNSGSALTISSLREDFLAKTSALREIRLESAGKGADSGLNSLVSFAKWDQDSCSWRIPTSLFGSGWDEFSGIWPDSGMMRHGECSALRRSVLVMFAKECGLLQSGIIDNKHGISEGGAKFPTPLARDYRSGDIRSHGRGDANLNDFCSQLQWNQTEGLAQSMQNQEMLLALR